MLLKSRDALMLEPEIISNLQETLRTNTRLKIDILEGTFWYCI